MFNFDQLPQIISLLQLLQTVERRGRYMSRGRKRTLSARLKNFSTAIKTIVPIVGAMVLVKRGELDRNDLAVIAAQVIDTAPKLEAAKCFPGPNWIVSEIAAQRGKTVSDVSIDEIFSAILDLARLTDLAQLNKQLQEGEIDAETAREIVMDVLNSLQKYIGA